MGASYVGRQACICQGAGRLNARQPKFIEEHITGPEDHARDVCVVGREIQAVLLQDFAPIGEIDILRTLHESSDDLMETDKTQNELKMRRM